MTPDYSQGRLLFNVIGSVDDHEIIPNWDATTNPYSPPYSIPSDGFLWVRVHAENFESSTTFVQRGIQITVNGVYIAVADASSGGFQSHIEDTDSNMVPVKAGDIVRYGSNTHDPNGTYNLAQARFFPLRTN